VYATDDQRWAEQVSDIRSDGEAGVRFLTFFTFWFDTAETLLWEGTGGQSIGADPVPNMAIMDAVRMALQMAEQQYGFLSVDLIGQMLCVASMHWEQGKEMTQNLTFIEHRVMEEALARKIAALQNAAKVPMEENPPQSMRGNDT